MNLRYCFQAKIEWITCDVYIFSYERVDAFCFSRAKSLGFRSTKYQTAMPIVILTTSLITPVADVGVPSGGRRERGHADCHGKLPEEEQSGDRQDASRHSSSAGHHHVVAGDCPSRFFFSSLFPFLCLQSDSVKLRILLDGFRGNIAILEEEGKAKITRISTRDRDA